MSRKNLLAIIGIALVPFLAFAWTFDFICDDAYISFRYARHLAEGAGLIFNAGEVPPVEGYSNFLWVLWLAVFDRFGIPLEFAARISSVLCGGVLLALVLRFLARQPAFGVQTIAATGLFFALLPPVAVWSTSGLETMPFALACFGVFERLCGEEGRPYGLQAGLCAACAALLRVDGALWAGLLIGVAALSVLRSGSRGASRRALLIAGGILTIALVLHVSWRYSYYGDWLANTAYVKGQFSSLRLVRGLKYVLSLGLLMPVTVLVPLAVLSFRGRPAHTLAVQAGTFVSCVVFGAVYLGGDFMAMGRFLVVATPFLAILFAIVFARVAGSLGVKPAWTLASVCLTSLLLVNLDVEVVPKLWFRHLSFRLPGNYESEVDKWRGMRSLALEHKALGRALAIYTRPGESIILEAIGAIGYETELFIYDEYGLVSREVAHREGPLLNAAAGHDKRVPPEFFMKYRPTYFKAWIAPSGASETGWMPTDWRQTDWGSRAEIERRALDVASGFAPNTELRLVRIHWDR